MVCLWPLGSDDAAPSLAAMLPALGPAQARARQAGPPPLGPRAPRIPPGPASSSLWQGAGQARVAAMPLGPTPPRQGNRRRGPPARLVGRRRPFGGLG